MDLNWWVVIGLALDGLGTAVLVFGDLVEKRGDLSFLYGGAVIAKNPPQDMSTRDYLRMQYFKKTRHLRNGMLLLMLGFLLQLIGQFFN